MPQNTRNSIISHLFSDLDSSFAAIARRNISKRQTKSIKRVEFTRRQQQEVENERREREKHARTLIFFVVDAARKKKTARQTQKKTARQTHEEAKRCRAHEEALIEIQIVISRKKMRDILEAAYEKSQRSIKFLIKKL